MDVSIFKVKTITSDQLKFLPIRNGQYIQLTDTLEEYLDFDGTRTKMREIIVVDSIIALRSIQKPITDKFYFVKDPKSPKLYYYNGNDFVSGSNAYNHPVAENVTPGEYRCVNVDEYGHVISASNPVLPVKFGGTGTDSLGTFIESLGLPTKTAIEKLSSDVAWSKEHVKTNANNTATIRLLGVTTVDTTTLVYNTGITVGENGVVTFNTLNSININTIDINSAGNSVFNNTTINGLTVTDMTVTNDATIDGDINIGGNIDAINSNVTSKSNTTQNESIANNLSVGNNSTLNHITASDISVTDNISTFNLSVGNAVTAVSINVTNTNSENEVTNNLDVNGPADINGNLDVHGQTNIGSINSTGIGLYKENVTFEKDINVNGTINGTANKALSADKLYTARDISFDGAISGSVSFDGSTDVSITTTLNNVSVDKLSGILPIEKGGTGNTDGITTKVTTTQDNVSTINIIGVSESSPNEIKVNTNFKIQNNDMSGPATDNLNAIFRNVEVYETVPSSLVNGTVYLKLKS